MIIAKFGGTSVSSYERVQTLTSIVASEIKRKPVIVVSALARITDLLLSAKDAADIKSIHKALIDSLWRDEKKRKKIYQYIDSKIKEINKLIKKRNSSKEFLDKLASYGEIMSSYIITQALRENNINAVQVIASDIIVTDSNFGSSEFLVKPTRSKAEKMLLPLIEAGQVPVVTGFIGADKKGRVTTLGRGGSDYTASIIGFCLKAEEIQIWTDVDGIFTADPRIVEDARSLQTVSFKEASELAAFGAKVLHPRTIRPAVRHGIPVRVLNTFDPVCKGTLIAEASKEIGQIKAVSFKKRITLVNLYATEMLLQKGFLAKIFRVFAEYNISIDLVSVSEVSVSVSLDNKDNLEKATEALSGFASVSVEEDLGMVSMIGEGITSNTKTIKKVFELLDKEKILARMISLSAANINISIVVDSRQVQTAVKILHREFLFKKKHHQFILSDTISQ